MMAAMVLGAEGVQLGMVTCALKIIASKTVTTCFYSLYVFFVLLFIPQAVVL